MPVKAIDLARVLLVPPTGEHEAYNAGPFTGSWEAPPKCELCKGPVLNGLEISYRLRGTVFADRRSQYVHRACLKPLKTAWEKDDA